MAEQTLSARFLPFVINKNDPNFEAIAREKKAAPNRPLAEALEVVLDEEDDDLPCLVCHYS